MARLAQLFPIGLAIVVLVHPIVCEPFWTNEDTDVLNLLGWTTDEELPLNTTTMTGASENGTTSAEVVNRRASGDSNNQRARGGLANSWKAMFSRSGAKHKGRTEKATTANQQMNSNNATWTVRTTTSSATTTTLPTTTTTTTTTVSSTTLATTSVSSLLTTKGTGYHHQHYSAFYTTNHPNSSSLQRIVAQQTVTRIKTTTMTTSFSRTQSTTALITENATQGSTEVGGIRTYGAKVVNAAVPVVLREFTTGTGTTRRVDGETGQLGPTKSTAKWESAYGGNVLLGGGGMAGPLQQQAISITTQQQTSSTAATTAGNASVEVALCCQPGGIWSNWTALTQCNDTCGACGWQTFTRSCLSSAWGCICQGESTTVRRCNSTPCPFPRLSCCHRLNVSKDSVTRVAVCGTGDLPAPQPLLNCPNCCPRGGIWADWEARGQCTDSCGGCGTQLHTRQCASAAWGCPCSGPSSVNVVCNQNPCSFPRMSCCSGAKAKSTGRGGKIICGSEVVPPINGIRSCSS